MSLLCKEIKYFGNDGASFTALSKYTPQFSEGCDFLSTASKGTLSQSVSYAIVWLCVCNPYTSFTAALANDF